MTNNKQPQPVHLSFPPGVDPQWFVEQSGELDPNFTYKAVDGKLVPQAKIGNDKYVKKMDQETQD